MIGLPHCHILLILDENDKPRTAEDYDKIVCAELPNPTLSPLAFATISQFNIHSHGAYCLDSDNQCTKYYPKDFNEFTYEEENGYPCYRRRNDLNNGKLMVKFIKIFLHL